jgi:hypothetical protein
MKTQKRSIASLKQVILLDPGVSFSAREATEIPWLTAPQSGSLNSANPADKPGPCARGAFGLIVLVVIKIVNLKLVSLRRHINFRKGDMV